jgi:hypothetical protein
MKHPSGVQNLARNFHCPRTYGIGNYEHVGIEATLQNFVFDMFLKRVKTPIK